MGVACLTLLLGCAAIGTWTEVSAQVGLKRSPIASPRIRHGTHDEHDKNDIRGRLALGLFSKWAAIDQAQRRSKPGVMDSQLEGIFRGVAYGVTTESPRTISSTVTTTTISSTSTTSTSATSTTTNYSHSDIPENDGVVSGTIIPNYIDSKDNIEDWELLREPSPLPVWPRKEEFSILPSQEPPVHYPYMEASITPTKYNDRINGKPTNQFRDVGVIRSDVKQVSWIQSLGIFWEVHVYIAAGLYVILMLLAAICLARTRSHLHLIPQGYYITLHLLMFLAAFLRCVPLFHDPYGAEQRLPKALSQAVEETAWPCLIAALGVVTIAIIKAWSCPRTLHKYTYAPVGLVVITAIHLVMVLTAHLAAGLIPLHAAPLCAAAQSVSVAWGCTVGISGLVATLRVGRSWGKLHNQLLFNFNRMSSKNTNATYNSTTALIHGTRLTFVACLAQIALVALNLYLLVEPQHVLNLPPVNPWKWIAFQSTMRLLEIFAWIFLVAVSALNAGASRKCVDSSGEMKLLTVLGCHCCGTSSSVTMHNKGNDISPVMCHNDQTIKNGEIQTSIHGIQADISANSVIRRGNTEIKHGKKNPVRRSATLHGNPSDIILPKRKTSEMARPSSVIFDDSGFIRFKFQDESIQIPKDYFKPSSPNIPTISVADHSNSSINHQMQKTGNDLPLSKGSKESPTYDNIHIPSSPTRIKEDNQSTELFINASANGPYIKSPSKIDSELYAVISNLINNHEDAASITDISSTDAMSPAPPSEIDGFKYAASTCSSISAANSFDVCMYDDFELSQYYQHPSSSSSHTYASLNQPFNPSYSNQSVLYKENLKRNGYGSQPAIAQLPSVLGSNKSRKEQIDDYSNYYTNGSLDRIAGTSDSDIYDSNQSHEEDSSPLPRRIHNYLYQQHNIHDITPDSGLALDSSGITDEASCEDSESSTQSPLFNKRQGILSKVVRKNLALNNDGYSPLKGEDLIKYQQLHHNHQQLLQNQCHIPIEKVRNNISKHIRLNDIRAQNLKNSETSFTQPEPHQISSRGLSFSERSALKEKQRLFLQQQLQKRIKEEKTKQQVKEQQLYKDEHFNGGKGNNETENATDSVDNTRKSNFSNIIQNDINCQPYTDNNISSISLQANWGDADNNNWSIAKNEKDILKTNRKNSLNCTTSRENEKDGFSY